MSIAVDELSPFPGIRGGFVPSSSTRWVEVESEGSDCPAMVRGNNYPAVLRSDYPAMLRSR